MGTPPLSRCRVESRVEREPGGSDCGYSPVQLLRTYGSLSRVLNTLRSESIIGCTLFSSARGGAVGRGRGAHCCGEERHVCSDTRAQGGLVATNISVCCGEERRVLPGPRATVGPKKRAGRAKLDRPPMVRSEPDYLIRAIFFTTSVSAVVTLYRYTPVETCEPLLSWPLQITVCSPASLTPSNRVVTSPPRTLYTFTLT